MRSTGGPPSCRCGVGWHDGSSLDRQNDDPQRRRSAQRARPGHPYHGRPGLLVVVELRGRRGGGPDLRPRRTRRIRRRLRGLVAAGDDSPITHRRTDDDRRRRPPPARASVARVGRLGRDHPRQRSRQGSRRSVGWCCWGSSERTDSALLTAGSVPPVPPLAGLLPLGRFHAGEARQGTRQRHRLQLHPGPRARRCSWSPVCCRPR